MGRQKKSHRGKNARYLGQGAKLICLPTPKKLDSNRLARDYSNDVTSQGGEDGILEEVFKIIDSVDSSDIHWCVEFGAWDGKHLSNTWNLLNKDGESDWSGVLIEASKVKFLELQEQYKERNDVHCLNTMVGLSGGNFLHDILKKTPIPSRFDLLSIDIDGADYWYVLQTFCELLNV